VPPPVHTMSQWRGNGGERVVRYLVRRILQMIPILLGATVLIFLVVKMAPGDPFSGMISPRIDPSKIEEARRRLCLDCPLPLQYWGWLKAVLQGNLGTSIRFHTPVAEMVRERLGPTAVLGISSTVIAYVVGIPIGVLSARRQNSWLDHLSTMLAFGGLSIPAFFFGLLLLKTFSLGGLKLFPSSGYTTPGSDLTGFAGRMDVASHLVLPSLALGITSIAVLMRYVRSAMLEVLRQDYVRTARAKGLAEQRVVYKHALRNAMIPVVTLLGLELPNIVGGAIITESIFIWPGIGRLQFTAIGERDYPVMMGLNLLFAAMVMLGSLIADIGYAVVDPRIRYD
jgi:peptide/nickel transport system permease protein